jgi:DNA-binding beta-propeller fold protein YncE
MNLKRVLLISLLAGASSVRSQAQSIYVSDLGAAARVDVLSLAGVQITSFAIAGAPAGTVSDSAGNLYIASGGSGSGVITKLDPQGHASNFASGNSLGDPEGLAFDSSGNLYVATHLGGTIIKITPQGNQSEFAASMNGSSYYGLAFSKADGDIYATAGNAIYQFTLQGARTLVTSIPGASPIAVDALGNLYVAGDDPQIYRVTPQGVVTVFALNAHSLGLVFDNAGNLYSSNVFNSTVEKYNTLGAGTTFAMGFDNPRFLSFGPTIPEPSTQLLLFVGIVTVLGVRYLFGLRHND